MQCGSMRIKRSKRRGSKQIKRRSAVKSKCRDYLQTKIKKNMKELKKGRWVSRAQAVAVSYSQVKKSHPECKRSLAKRSQKKKRSIRK